MSQPKHMKSKICLVGEATVGKTSLVRRYVLDEFHDGYIQTLGTKVSKKVVQVASPEETIQVDMSIWDIMGQPGFLNLLSDSYFAGAHGILAVADFTRKATQDRLEPWIRNVRQVAGAVPVLLAVNKVDLVAGGEHGAPEISEAATRYANGCVATSAKTGENVEAAFRQLAALVAGHQLQPA